MKESFFIAQERKNSQIVLWLPIIASATHPITNSTVGSNFSPMYTVYQNNRWVLVGETHAFDSLVKNGIKKVKEDPYYIKYLIKQWNIKAGLMNQFTESIQDQNLTKLSNRELYHLYDQYYQLSFEAFPYAEPITWSLRFDFIKELESQIKKTDNLHDHVATLISSEIPSFVTKEELAILKIVQKMKNQPELVELFKEPIKKIEQRLILEFPELNQIFDKHTRDYCWIPFDNGSILWTKEYFIEVVQDHIRKNIDIDKKIAKIQNYSTDILKKKEKIAKELNLSHKLVQLFEAVADSGYLLDIKKEKYSYSHYHMRRWAEEAARRLNLSYRQIEFMLKEDLKNGLLHNKLDKNLINERQRLWAIEFRDGKIKSFYKKDALKIIKIYESKIDQNTTEISGTCAQPGTVRGSIRLLFSAQDINLMKQGEILVTTMTTPDFIPAMKKAKAIITDEGGITSHAAIVSRELGIPCIVGTTIATQVFKDGDLVEFHGASGIVRKLGIN